MMPLVRDLGRPTAWRLSALIKTLPFRVTHRSGTTWSQHNGMAVRDIHNILTAPIDVPHVGH